MKKKTEMQKFIESLEDFVEKHNVKNIDKYPGSMAISLIEVIIEEAKTKLELERKQIIEFAWDCQDMFKHEIEAEYNQQYGGEK